MPESATITLSLPLCVLDVAAEVGTPLAHQVQVLVLVRVVQGLAGHHGGAPAVHLQRADGGHHHGAMGLQAAVPEGRPGPKQCTRAWVREWDKQEKKGEGSKGKERAGVAD